MMVLRKLAVALLSVGVMLPGLGHALAVSDLKTKSALGEPFLGEVELSELGDLNADEIKISLATQEDFERLGVDRVYFLTELKFDVVVNQGARSFIRVSSLKPVREPYLDFVIRVSWPGNARLQEVTALLDPPLVSDTAAPELSQAVSSAPAVEPVVRPTAALVSPAATAPEPVVAPKAVVARNTDVVPRPVRQTIPQPVPSVQPNGYRTQSGDTMSKIAQQFRPGDASVSQTMVAIQRANPGAFANSNINLLKRGQTLNIPTESQIREVSAQEAIASVRQQTESWHSAAAPVAAKPALEAQQLNATAKADAHVAPAPVVAKPEMKLLATQTGKQGSAAAGKESAGIKPADAKRLDENKVKTEAAKAEKDKLASKVGTLGTQVKANDKQIEIQNAKLAELQAKLKEEQAAKDAAAKLKDQQAGKDAAKLKDAQAQKEAAAVAADAAAADADAAAASAARAKAVPPAPAIASQPLPAAPKKVVVAPVEEVAQESLPLGLIGSVVGALALLGGGAFFWNQKRRRDQEEEYAALAELEASDEAVDVGLPNFASNDQAHDEDSWLNEAGHEPVAAVQDRVLADPIEEVEQYLAFERYPQAVGFLNKAIASNPDRSDLRLKLLEVYARLDDHHGFAEQEDWFENAGDVQALRKAEELKAGMTPPPRVVGKDDAIDFERALVAEEDDLPSLEDLEMDFNATVSASSPSLSVVKDTDLDLPSLDDDFNFDSSLDSAEFSSSAADSGLSLDETDDFSFTKPAEKIEEAVLDDDLSFELDTDAFDSKPVARAEAHIVDHAADEGMDFSLDDDFSTSAESTAVSELGLGDLADFDNAPELKEPEIKTSDDDLSFSLDDLEADASLADMDGDFSLDDGKGGAADFSFDESVQTDSGLNDVVSDFDSTLRAADVAPSVVESVPAHAEAPAADLGMDDEFDFLSDTDENATKLDLARAYIDMGDMEGARDILQEVLSEGNSSQKDEAKGLISQVG